MKELHWQEDFRAEGFKFASTITTVAERILHLNRSIHSGLRNLSCVKPLCKQIKVRKILFCFIKVFNFNPSHKEKKQLNSITDLQ